LPSTVQIGLSKHQNKLVKEAKLMLLYSPSKKKRKHFSLFNEVDVNGQNANPNDDDNPNEDFSAMQPVDPTGNNDTATDTQNDAPADDTATDTPTDNTTTDDTTGGDDTNADDTSQDTEDFTSDMPSDTDDTPDTGTADDTGGGDNGAGPDTDADSDSPDFSADMPDGSDGDTGDADAEGDDGGEGTDDSGGDTSDTGATGGDGTVTADDARGMEKEIFKDLTPDQVDLKHQELKSNFTNMYEMTSNLINRVNEIPSNDKYTSSIAFISEQLSNLRQMITDYMNNVYSTKSYMENAINYNRFLATLQGVNKILEEISKDVEANNPDKKKENEEKEEEENTEESQ
jgi:hypothetical protein